MMQSRIVTHCLAVWNSYTGQLGQEDKDFFDDNIQHSQETDEFVVALELVKTRLERDGLNSQEAFERAYQLFVPYANRWGVELPMLVRVNL